MSGPRVAFFGLVATMVISGATAEPASASGITALARSAKSVNVVTPSLLLFPVVERKCPPFCPPFLKQHDQFYKRYDPKRPHFDDAHNDFHKFHRRPHKGPVIYSGWYRDYYDPFFYRPYTYDPYYDWPVYSKRISCGYASKLPRQNGYRNVKSYDCEGTTYGFYVTKGKKSYEVTISARDGHITSRKQY
jgi:hypothetical protein